MKIKTIKRAKNSNWTNWQKPVMTNYALACCDCGLVHRVNFRCIKIEKKKGSTRSWAIPLPKDKYEVQFKICRSNKLTKQHRKDKFFNL